MSNLDSVDKPECAEANVLAQKADNKLDSRQREDNYVCAGGVFKPDPTSTTSHPLKLMAGSELASSEAIVGGKYSGFARGAGASEPSNVACSSGTHEYADAQYKGHAEAKIIEHVFREAKTPDLFTTSGPPKGTLYIKLRGYTKRDKNKPKPCPECEKLIKCAEETEGFKIEIC